MKSIRRQMMSGVLPQDCEGCAVPLKKELYRLSFNSHFQHHLENIRTSTKQDGSTSSPIVSLDYRGHTCNLKCRTCGPWSSSAWLDTRSADGHHLRTVLYGSNFADMEKSISRSPYQREFLDIAEHHPIEDIYFAGGEPLASREHYRVLDYLIESRRCSTIDLNYNTNLSLNEASITGLVSRIRHFRSVYIACSIDGSREVAEYIRAGLNFDQFESNLRRLLAAQTECPQLTVALDPTITSLFLLDLKEFCQFALSYSIPVVAKIMGGNDGPAGYLRCEFLPQTLRARVISEWRTYYASLSDHSQALLISLRNNLELAEGVASFPGRQMQSCANQAVVADTAFQSTRRFDHFLKRDPEIYAWWESLMESQCQVNGDRPPRLFDRLAAFLLKPRVRRARKHSHRDS